MIEKIIGILTLKITNKNRKSKNSNHKLSKMIKNKYHNLCYARSFKKLCMILSWLLHVAILSKELQFKPGSLKIVNALYVILRLIYQKYKKTMHLNLFSNITNDLLNKNLFIKYLMLMIVMIIALSCYQIINSCCLYSYF